MGRIKETWVRRGRARAGKGDTRDFHFTSADEMNQGVYSIANFSLFGSFSKTQKYEGG